MEFLRRMPAHAGDLGAEPDKFLAHDFRQVDGDEEAFGRHEIRIGFRCVVAKPSYQLARAPAGRYPSAS